MTIRFDVAAPYEVEETDVPFARPDGLDLLARVYRPRGQATERLAGIVDVHGGAWNRNDRLTGAVHGRALAASGLVVASLDFRQGPDHRHPAASADVAAGVRWMRTCARNLGVDPSRIGIVGSSSGGQLALLVALEPGAPEHAATPIVLADGSTTWNWGPRNGPQTPSARSAPGNPWRSSDLRQAPGEARGDASVAFAVALYPVADPLARYQYVLGRENDGSGFDAKRLIASHRAYFADEAAMADASVTRVVTAREATALPPLFLAQPELDDNVPDSITEAFVRAYREAGGAVEHVRFPGARHGFIVQATPDAEKCIALMREFIGRQLTGRR